jgi:small subunit ribosomal protein S13
MPRLLGVDIPGKKRVAYALCYIYGIGLTRAKLIVEEAKIDAAKKADDLTPDELRSVLGIIQTRYRVEGDLRREVAQNIRRLISMGSYRGVRHRKGLPVRGQRTRTNARTRKGPKKTVGAVRSKEVRSALRTPAAPAAEK